MNKPDHAPRGLSIETVAAQFDTSPKTIMRKIASGELRAVKMGRRTLVTVESIDAFWAGLPPAQFRAPRQKIAA